MARLFYIVGKSSTGKDTIYREVLGQPDLELNPLVMYTTRPIREGETDGKEYHFADEEILKNLEREGRVIEKRAYHTIHGIWTYFTVDNEHVDLNGKDYLAIGTLVSYEKLRDYYGAERIVPIYVEVEDGMRLARALDRERSQIKPNYDEMCRRFLADSADFSEENLEKAGIKKRFQNEELQKCVEKITEFIFQSK